MTLSTAMTITARVAVTGFLTVSCFKRVVVDNTAQVLFKAEKASAGLAVYSICLSTITLVLAADKSAQRILSNGTKYTSTVPKDDDTGSNLPSANDTTPVTLQPVEPPHLQPFLSPSQLRLIESTETISAPNSTCTPNDNTTSATPKPIRPYHLQPSPISSPLPLIESTETTSGPVPITYSNTCSSCITLTSPGLYCKRLSIDSSTTLVSHDDSVTDVFSDDASDANDCESFNDESTVHEDNGSESQPRKEPASEPTIGILIARMNALTFDDLPRLPKLRPLILVNIRHKASISIPCPPLPEPAYSMDALTRRIQALSLSDSPFTDAGISLSDSGCPIDALTRRMEALSLGDRRSSTSKLKPLILVAKHATRHFKLPPLATPLLRRPRSKTAMRGQMYWPVSLDPTIWAHPQPK
ncbi:hypothetical protein BDR07DRAFT_1375291 [Suillus spraguei]|nr:hypothetical protein BDR07DRAFT_1375291 [Suillus spraguei]